MGIFNLCLTPKCGGSVLRTTEGEYKCTLCSTVYDDPSIYSGPLTKRQNFGWTRSERVTALAMRLEGHQWCAIAEAVDKSECAVRKYFQRNFALSDREAKAVIASDVMELVRTGALQVCHD